MAHARRPSTRARNAPSVSSASTLAPSGLNNWVNPHVNSWNQVDLNITRNFAMEGADMAAYFVVQNALKAANSSPPTVADSTSSGWVRRSVQRERRAWP